MGRVSNKIVKNASKKIVEQYYKRLTLDFYTNKRVIEEVVETPSKKVRNKIAGYTTRLMRRIQRGPVKGVTLKLQEYERERKMDYEPLVSDLDTRRILIDPDTEQMVKSVIKRIAPVNPEDYNMTNLELIKKPSHEREKRAKRAPLQ
ncbi:40S ribosomal protein S17 [Bonamia ostreae]|uniref:40S ribosomal protein S17 n=1 Tax=Bonamia ostreae TaxID=126728 RepID=A0ABV2AGG4_9EUKA